MSEIFCNQEGKQYSVDGRALESRSSKREFLVEAAWEQGAGSRERVKALISRSSIC